MNSSRTNSILTTTRAALAIAGLAALGSISLASGCSEDGPIEQAGDRAQEAVEDAADWTGDVIEDAGDAIDNVIDDGTDGLNG